jgi:hypothetical protein
MSETTSINSDIISSADPTATASSQKVAPPIAKDKRKGKGARNRDSETFRSKKNEIFDRHQQQGYKDKRAPIDNVETLFGPINLTLAQPILKFSITTKLIPKLSTMIADVLHNACKVPVDPSFDDAQLISIVASLQIEAKSWYARDATPYADFDQLLESRAKRVSSALPDVIFPLSYYIEQIGRVTVDHQIMVPEILGYAFSDIQENPGHYGFGTMPINTMELPEGNSLTGHRVWLQCVNIALGVERGILTMGERATFTENFVTAPNNFNWFGVLQFVPAGNLIPTLDEIISRYNNLIGRINRRVNNVLVSGELRKGLGTTAQLVTAIELEPTEKLIEVWTNRRIDDASLTVGGIFEFGDGLADNGDSHSRDFRTQEATFRVEGILSRFVRNLTNRLR